MGHAAGHDIDPTFYRSPADAISAPPEQLAYVVAFDRAAQQPDALAVLDTDPASDRYGQVVGWADRRAAKAGYSRPHTLHCGPDGIFVSCLGGGNGADGPGGIALLDHDTFDVLRAWETDRGDQYLAYNAWWHLMISAAAGCTRSGWVAATRPRTLTATRRDNG